MPQAIIIGKGPAGISAALYLKRAGIDVTVIGKDEGALKKAHVIGNYYGLSSNISGIELYETGIKQAEELDCDIVDDEVLSISFDMKLTVTTKLASYTGDAVIIATGAARNTPKITGLAEFEGKGVSYCAVCDAFFYRKQAVCVLGNGEYALHEALELLPVASSVTLLTDGLEPAVIIPEGIKLDKRKIASINGDKTVKSVSFTDGEALEIAGIFVAVGVASSSALARKLGAETDKNSIVTDKYMATNIPGLFAAGDCTGGLLQVAKAVSEGAIAATSAIKYLRSI